MGQKIFEEIYMENFSKSMQGICQSMNPEVLQTSNRIIAKKANPKYIVVKLL